LIIGDVNSRHKPFDAPVLLLGTGSVRTNNKNVRRLVCQFGSIFTSA
jgi:hypothetical protein